MKYGEMDDWVTKVANNPYDVTVWLTDGMDGLWWNGHRKGVYKVSSGYKTLDMTFPQTTKWPWKQVWKARTPLKVACFSWLQAKEIRDSWHLFLYCRIADLLWKILINLRGILWTMPSKVVDTLSSWEEAEIGAKNMSYWRTTPACIWQTIWKRNARCFEDRSRTLQKIKPTKTPTSHKQNTDVVDIGNFCTRRSGLPVKQPYVKTSILLLKGSHMRKLYKQPSLKHFLVQDSQEDSAPDSTVGWKDRMQRPSQLTNSIQTDNIKAVQHSANIEGHIP
ncbi:hypothetical protein H5410_052295 [Solanum commersonii]|uniref:Reverse transcriptase zinc-binding domain-containing protein n=1 Tax=Solanum commersonii TaxID=4109 RepID=A0A9J5X2Z4_SOLCO|nr:hypothetical protein H5410_052295 [Solanum commersonii]